MNFPTDTASLQVGQYRARCTAPQSMHWTSDDEIAAWFVDVQTFLSMKNFVISLLHGPNSTMCPFLHFAFAL